MALVLVRIDDRLIHGQVTVGWGGFLNPDRILLVSNEIAQNSWEKELYQSCVPFNINVSILSVEESTEALINKSFANERVILLAESPEIILRLLEHKVEFKQVNIGGMHQKPGKKMLLPYVFVDDNDRKMLEMIAEHDVDIVCQDLPQEKKEKLSNLLDK